MKKGEKVLFLYWDDVPREGTVLDVVHHEKKGDREAMDVASCSADNEAYQYSIPVDRVRSVGGTPAEKEKWKKDVIAKYKKKHEHENC